MISTNEVVVHVVLVSLRRLTLTKTKMHYIILVYEYTLLSSIDVSSSSPEASLVRVLLFALKLLFLELL